MAAAALLCSHLLLTTFVQPPTGGVRLVVQDAVVARRATAMRVEPATVEIFTTVGCPFCVRAKKKLLELGVPFVERDVAGDERLRAEMVQRSSRTSVPQIFIGETHIGGCDDLLAADASGQLVELLGVKGIVLSRAVSVSVGAGDGALDVVADRNIDDLLPRDGILNFLPSPADRSEADALSAAQLGARLQASILRLYDEFVVADGSRVDYAQMVRSGRLHAYVALSSALRSLSPSALPVEPSARLALWINVYNALVIHATAVVGSPLDREGRAAFYSGQSGVAYEVAGLRLSLDDVEHGILRGSPPGDARSFGAGDVRLALAVPREQFDPRIHFALNCGARSCPPIKIFDAANLERGLALAAQAFCEGEVRVDELGGTVRLSKLFEWYRTDFGASDSEVLARVVSYLPPGSSSALALARMLEQPGGGERRLRLEYSEYDWGTNAIE